MTQSLESDFGIFRSLLWPIHRHELRKVLPMLFVFFLVCFNYSVLRNIKDSLVVTASGAEVIPYIKLWAILPMAIVSTYIFTKLSNRFSQEKMFYIIISFFLVVFALFGFILYPMRDAIHFTEAAETICAYLPDGCRGFVMMCRDWSFTLFYAIAELWGSLVLFVLVWGFANEITKINEARRFYGVFSIGSNIAAILAGYAGSLLSLDWGYHSFIPFGNNAWEQSLGCMIGIVVLSGILAILSYRWMNKNVLVGPEYDEIRSARLNFERKKKLSLIESFKHLSNSKYLLCIVVLVVGYNLTINLVEVVWKDQVRRVYISAADYNSFTSTITMLMGMIATLTAIIMPFIIDRFGWTKIAMITPLIMLVTSMGFFGMMFYGDSMSDYLYVAMGTTPIAIAVFFGAAQNCLTKAAKYSVFDMTKEMAFIPLSHESKLKGKAAIDGVGSRLGKSGGSVIHQGLFMFCGSLIACSPYLAVIVIGMIVAWIIAVRSLGQQFESVVEQESLKTVQAAT
jgi:AAA family ATP:ADP antiporter